MELWRRRLSVSLQNNQRVEASTWDWRMYQMNGHLISLFWVPEPGRESALALQLCLRTSAITLAEAELMYSFCCLQNSGGDPAFLSLAHLKWSQFNVFASNSPHKTHKAEWPVKKLFFWSRVGPKEADMNSPLGYATGRSAPVETALLWLNWPGWAPWPCSRPPPPCTVEFDGAQGGTLSTDHR